MIGNGLVDVAAGVDAGEAIAVGVEIGLFLAYLIA